MIYYLKKGTKKSWANLFGNDRKKHKCTYVTKYGLEESKKILENITNEAITIIEQYGDKGEFLKELAIYIKDRNK